MKTAAQAGLVGCRMCGLAQNPAPACERCGARLTLDPHRSLQSVWALLITGMVAYIPANLYPMLVTKTLLTQDASTIVGGALELFHHGSYGIAIIILVASVAIPIGKFLAIALLAYSVSQKGHFSAHTRLKLFEIVEIIGRWSMIDVFVVAILAALIQLNALATIKPGIAAVAFAGSVIFTMLAAQSFDPRLIWNTLGEKKGPKQ